MNVKEQFVLENYEIHNDGKIFSKYTNKFLKFRTDKDGYFDVTLVYNTNGDRMPFRVHRLVALKYLTEIENYNVVNHKDLNKQNNNVDNLEWSTVSLNTQHGYSYSAYSNIRRVKAIDKEGIQRVFPSTSHAARYYNYSNPTTIQAILEGRTPNPITRGNRQGLYFEYTNESVTTIERISTTVSGE
jgi:hypothetical protein